MIDERRTVPISKFFNYAIFEQHIFNCEESAAFFICIMFDRWLVH